jgi:acetyl esterase
MTGAFKKTAFACLTLIGIAIPIGVFLVGATVWYVALPLAVFVAFGCFEIGRKNRLHAETTVWNWKKTWISILVVAFGAVSTRLLQSQVSALLSSSLVALFVTLVWKDVEGEAFLGSFLGMTLFGYGTVPMLVLGSLISGLLLSWIGPWLHHVGGRSGFLAFLGVLVVYSLFASPLTVDIVRAATAFDVLVALSSALLVIEAKNRLGLTAVQASAGVGLILGVLMISIPAVPASTWLIGYGATFVAMTTKKVLSDSAVAFAAILYPFLYLSIQTAFVGYGGKLGMVAMLTVLAVLGASAFLSRLLPQNQPEMSLLSRRAIVKMLKPEFKAISIIRMPHSPWLLSRSNDLLTLGVSRVKPMAGVAETNVSIPTRDGSAVSATLFVPETRKTDGAIVYYPGGGFVMRSTPFHKTTAQRFCADLGAAVLFVDYRLAPTYRFPTALFDALDAYAWLKQTALQYGIDPANIVVAGDSAGGNLAVAVSLWCREHGLGMPKGMLLVYPAADKLDAGGSRSAYWNAPMFSGRDYEMVKRHYYSTVSESLMMYAAPLIVETLAGMPPAYIETAQFDPLHDDGEKLAARLKNAGVDVEYHEQLGAPHGYDAAMTAPTTLRTREARKAWLASRLGS